MKKVSLFLISVLFSFSNFAQEGFEFIEDFRLPATSVKDQHRAGTCWSYSALSFIESELLRMHDIEIDLSELFVVNHCYRYKAEKYVRMHGKTNFGGGGAFHDALWVIQEHGMVPEKTYKGLSYGTDNHVHGEIDAVLSNYVKAVIKNKNKKLSTAWQDGFNAVVDSYLGPLPQNFNYKGNTYTPRSFADDYMKIKPEDYVTIGSYTHHPFYETFILEVPDNWLWGEIYNVPVDEFSQIIDYALDNKYTIAWAADVSHKGFSHSKGIAVIPETNIENLSGLEQAKWEDLGEHTRKSRMHNLNEPLTEKKITQELRQAGFDNYSTTDDHGMHIIGKAHDKNKTPYYIVKNSWGETGKLNGYFYASKPFVVLQATNIMLHKDAVPPKIRKKLGF